MLEASSWKLEATTTTPVTLLAKVWSLNHKRYRKADTVGSQTPPKSIKLGAKTFQNRFQEASWRGLGGSQDAFGRGLGGQNLPKSVPRTLLEGSWGVPRELREGSWGDLGSKTFSRVLHAPTCE